MRFSSSRSSVLAAGLGAFLLSQTALAEPAEVPVIADPTASSTRAATAPITIDPPKATPEVSEKPVRKRVDTSTPALVTVPATPPAVVKPVAAPKPAAPRPSMPRPAAKPVDPNDYTILKVNGDPVRKSRIEEIWNGLMPGKAPPFDKLEERVRVNVLRGIASEQLIYREAQKSGLAESPEIYEKLAKLKEKLVTQVYLEKKAEALVTDASLKRDYDRKVAELKGKDEIKARHILVDNEDKAEEILKALKDGESFEKLAAARSLDKANAAKGGELGWFSEAQMVPEFTQAAFRLKKGEVSAPVKTQFGWHVIELEDRRPIEVPSFDEVKGALREQEKAEALKVYIGKLVDSADIEYFDKSGRKLEFTKSPDRARKSD